jgi:DNA-directed RNA polymerase subunit K/omega
MSDLDKLTIDDDENEKSDSLKIQENDEVIDDSEENDDDEDIDEDIDEDEDNIDDDDEDEAEAEDEDEDEDEQDEAEDEYEEDGGQEDGEITQEKKKTAKKTKPKKITMADEIINDNVYIPDNVEITDEDYNSDIDDDEEEDFQRFDEEIKENIIERAHFEYKMNNYDEIYELSKVFRDSNNIIVDKGHRTIPVLTKYEKARILGLRAKQINTGSPPFVELKENIIDGYIIAQMELAEKKIPFIIRRPLPNKVSEYWKLEDLELI